MRAPNRQAAQHLEWLGSRYGAALLKSFTEKGARAIRNELRDTPKADDVVKMIGRLWRYAKEYQGMEDLGPDPTAEVGAFTRTVSRTMRGHANCARRLRRTRIRRSCARTICCATPDSAALT
jgi:hypothetical protein